MSAITGIFYRDGRKVDPELIKKMNDRLSHRGPDGSAVWCDGSVALGHQMLWTTPESLHEKLPFEDEESGLVITADARIDNRKELSEKLDIEDKEEVSDSYFILKAYEKWGEDCPDKLLGDFAFAIWDKNGEKLFCARDHMGVKPFYYYLDDDMFVFGTEIKALFCVPGVPYRLNEQKVAFHLLKMNTDKKFTFYKKVFSFTSAHYLILEKNSYKMKKYWKLDPESRIIMDSEEEYIKVFQDIFAKSVECRMRSAFQIGFELSGGLDSSSVVCMANKLLIDEKKYSNINTFSMIFNEFEDVDERYYIKKITDYCRINPNLIISDNISPLRNIETILWHQEQPFYTPNMTILSNMYQRMKDNNIRILLGGNGGDEIISHSRNYLGELANNMQWKKLVKELNAVSKRTNVGIFHLFFSKVLIYLIPFQIKMLYKKFFYFLYRISGKKANFILNSDFSRKLGGEDYLNNLRSKHYSKLNTARKLHYFGINNSSNQYFLEMLDKLVATFFIEPRYPFFDKRLIEFCYAIPTDMKFKSGWNRYIQRIAMENILPNEVQWRPFKKFFNSVYEKNLLLYENELLKKIFIYETPLIKEYVNLDLLKGYYQKYSYGNGNIVSNKDLWLATLLDLWLNKSKILSKK